MPTNNETIVAVPTDFGDIGQLRQFLVKLVIELDIVLGYRQGSTPREESRTAVLQLEFEEFKDSLDGGSIAPLPAFTQVVTDPPTQLEVQANTDAISSTGSTVNDIIKALQEAGILT